MEEIQIIERAVTFVVAILFSLTVHEAAHAWIAKLQGDNTAELQGRLSLNPLPHIDFLGTIVLPLIAVIGSMPVLGWAKPVPVDPRNFRSVWSTVWVAMAGPAANLILCFLCLVALVLFQAVGGELTSENSLFFPFIKLLSVMVGVNAILAVFNLIPLPPLDGAALMHVLLPHRWAQIYEERVAPYGMLILLFMAMTGGFFWVSTVASGYVSMINIIVQRILSFLF